LEKANQEKKRFKRTQKNFAFIMIDIDHFKKINDTYGHDRGDKVLIGVSRSLEKALRDQDIVARWGGEEFICLLPETEPDGALHAAEKIRKFISQLTHNCSSGDITVTVTIGVSVYHGKNSLETIIGQADRALYKGKENGRNQVCTLDCLDDNRSDS
jgi:diguanylate cyclase (GGDEF)-like protein